MSANSKASQLLNGFGNFMNGVSNAAREVVANPIADVAGLAAKGMMGIPNAISGGKVNKAIDTVVSAAKGEQPNSLQKQPEDHTSMAYAAGEGLTRGIDQAVAVLTLTEAAKQLPKAMQAGWKKILNKVKDAKSKSDQMKLAKEAREYLNKAMDENLRPAGNSSAPSYQQRAVAIDNQMHGGNMRTYVDETTDNANKTFKNMTSKMNAANMSKDPAAVKMRTARNEVYPSITDYTKQPNKTYAPLKPAEAAEVFVPYKGSNLKDVQHMQERVNNIAKMSDTEFRKYMDSVERADMAGYGPEWYDYQIEDLWHSAGRNSKSLGNLKNQIINRITYSYDPEQFGKVSGKWQEIVKNNALKNNKVYRKWKVKDIKDQYDELTKGITRDEARAERLAADSSAASRWMDAEDAKYAKGLGMTVDQLRSESLKHGLSPYSYFEHQKGLKDMGFKNMEELDKYVKQGGFESIGDAGDAYQRMGQGMNFKDFINKNSSNEYYNKVMKYDPSEDFGLIL